MAPVPKKSASTTANIALKSGFVRRYKVIKHVTRKGKPNRLAFAAKKNDIVRLLDAAPAGEY